VITDPSDTGETAAARQLLLSEPCQARGGATTPATVAPDTAATTEPGDSCRSVYTVETVSDTALGAVDWGQTNPVQVAIDPAAGGALTVSVSGACKPFHVTAQVDGDTLRPGSIIENMDVKVCPDWRAVAQGWLLSFWMDPVSVARASDGRITLTGTPGRLTLAPVT